MNMIELCPLYAAAIFLFSSFDFVLLHDSFVHSENCRILVCELDSSGSDRFEQHNL